MKANKLKLNAEKTHLLVVGTAERLRILQNPVIVQMEGHTISEGVDKCELLLGVQIQANLKWNQQIQQLHEKLHTRLQTLKTITEGLFNSVLVYCLPLLVL